LRQGISRARRSVDDFLKLRTSGKLKCLADTLRLRGADPGIDRVIDECTAWLCRAQEHSSTHDGGAAHSFSLASGWLSSYPETTGYIVPTLIAVAKLRGDERTLASARRMVDWLVAIQLPDGGFQGGRVDSEPRVPVIFNTGQILFGLASGTAEFGEAYREPMRRAGDWLVAAQDSDGCWRKFASPFAKGGERTYDTHVAWGLLEAARLDPARKYAESAIANVHWALGHQRDNGWFDHCCLTDTTRPLTHTLGYTLRGVLEAHRFKGDAALLAAARRTADGLLSALQPNGFLPGRLFADWSPAVRWCCLTGSVQIAICWLMLFEQTGDERYRKAAQAANSYVRSTVLVTGDPAVRGGVGGSFPIFGAYGQYSYLNWAAKFCIDSQMLEQRLLT
jgi:hypothetical protein